MEGFKELPEERISKFGEQLAETIVNSMDRTPREPTLRMSSIGRPDRQLWYEFNLPPEKREQLKPENYLKFLYGHIIEDLILFLAEEAGHKVEGRQEELEIEGIKGHRDVILDGIQTDVKSASTFSFRKFKEHKLPESDPFGYIVQNESYLEAGQDDPRIIDKNKHAFLAVDKSLGHIVLDIYEKDPDKDIKALYNHKKEIIKLPEPPERCYPIKQDGYKNYKTGEFIANGNELLGTECSYCPYKFSCYDNIRTFLSSTGPKFFTKVVKTPKMLEIKEIEHQEEKETS